VSPYRQPGFDRRHAVIAEARRVRDTLVKAPRFLEVLVPLLRDEARRFEPLAVHGDQIDSPQEIIDALTACIDELAAEAEAIEVPF
jgi:hypothetical protein